MSLRPIITIIAILSFASAALARPQADNREEIVVIVYEFMLTSGGMPYAIKVFQVFRQSDRSDASRTITDTDKLRGADLIATHRYRPRPDEVGKKRYDIVLFDTRTHQLNRGARPQ
jgi:hypothetical protein